MAARWNIQEVPISFTLFDTPNMVAARVLQNAPDGYMVFIYKVTKNKPLYHAVVVSPEEREEIKKGSMKEHYKYQVKNIKGNTLAKIAALELLTQVMGFSEALVKDEMTPREKLMRKRFNIGNKITKDVIFEIHEIGSEVIIVAKGKKIPSHKFMKFSQFVEGSIAFPYFIAGNPFSESSSCKIIDSPYLNMVRDLFVVKSYYFQESGNFRGPTYTKGEIKIWFDNFDDEWFDKINITNEVKQTLINRSNTIKPLKLTNEFIPFTYVNTHYRNRGNRSNPSNLVIVKGGSIGVIKLEATTTRNINVLKDISIQFAPHFFNDAREQIIRDTVNLHILLYKTVKGYTTLTLEGLASEIIASIMTWIPTPLLQENAIRVNAWDGNDWSNQPCWIEDDLFMIEDAILLPVWDKYYP